MKTLRALPLLFALMYSCHAQNGPTNPTVLLNWTQSTTVGVTGNCIYRGTASKTYVLPALFCSTAPIVSYTDSTVARGTTYFYAVTAQLGKQESAYSVEAKAVVADLAPPTGMGSQETKLVKPRVGKGKGLEVSARVQWP